jgi:hypothetical protein
MALGKRQKALIGVFALGLAALAVDRVFLRPQGGAGKASGVERATVNPTARDPTVTSPDEAQRPTVAQRLDRLWSNPEANDVGVRDPFSLEGSWLAGSQEDPAAVPSPLTQFAKTHPLAAVVMDGRQSYAVVNDRVLKLGDRIDGFVLTSVGPKSAIFDYQGQQVILELAIK